MVNNGSGRVRLEFLIPSRSLIGYRSKFLTDTKGTGIMNSYLEGYDKFKGLFEGRLSGSMIATAKGESRAYALWKMEARGELFINPNT